MALRSARWSSLPLPSAFTQTTSSELLSSDYDNNSPQARHSSIDSGAGLHDQIPLAQAALATAELMMHVESRDVSPWGSVHSSTETCQGTINPCELSKNLDVLSSTSLSSYRSPSPSLSSLTDGTSSFDGTWTDSRESTASCFTSHSGSPALGHDYASPMPLDSSPYNLQHHSQYVTTEEDDCCDPRTVVKQEDDGLYAQWINGANTVSSNALSSSLPRKKGRCSPGNGRFVCEKCGLGCSRKFNLRQHMSTHLAFRPRPHSCEFCDMKFLRANERRRHEDSKHRNLRPFECNDCGAGFPRKDSFNRHVHDGCATGGRLVRESRKNRYRAQQRVMREN